MKDFWNERYAQQEFVYGKEPNVFLAQSLRQLPLGKIILPCEGEGRNAVFAAQLGWVVDAYDMSEAGKSKAMNLAQAQDVSINYTIEDANQIDFPENGADVVAFIYAHFPASIRQQIHQKALRWLKPGGIIILEAFNPDQLNKETGGPKELSMLYDEEMLRSDFQDSRIELLESLEIELNEGIYHSGKADVVRLIARKNEN